MVFCIGGTAPDGTLLGYAYPCYETHIYFVLKNAGTIPAHFKFQMTATGEGGDPPEPLYPLVYDPVLGGFMERACTVVPAIEFEIEMQDPTGLWVPFDPESAQMHGCEEWLCRIKVHFTNCALQCHTYKIYMTILAHQWNELPGPEYWPPP
jgi:hypothetical protein